MALVVPPSFVDASRHQPCEVRAAFIPYTPCLLTGASGKVYFRTGRFLLALRVLFAVGWHTGFPARARSLDATGDRYSSLQSFVVLVFDFFCCDLDKGTNKNALHPFIKDEERSNTALVVPPSFVDASRHQPRGVCFILTPDYGGIRRSSTLARGDFFSRLRVFIHSMLTYGLSTNRPFSGRNSYCYSSLRGLCFMKFSVR